MSEKNFVKNLFKTENILKFWRMRNLAIKCKGNVFKALPVFETIHLVLVINISLTVIKELNKI